MNDEEKKAWTLDGIGCILIVIGFILTVYLQNPGPIAVIVIGAIIMAISRCVYGKYPGRYR